VCWGEALLTQQRVCSIDRLQKHGRLLPSWLGESFEELIAVSFPSLSWVAESHTYTLSTKFVCVKVLSNPSRQSILIIVSSLCFVQDTDDFGVVLGDLHVILYCIHITSLSKDMLQ
jgi:hypothetical protein